MKRPARLTSLVALVLAMSAAGPVVERATAGAFPGQNGRIAFVSDRDGNREVYTANPDGTDPRRLTESTGVDADPAWSPDGTRIAFSRGAVSTPQDIWVMGADGTGQVQLNSDDGSGASDPAWSPDGTQIAFSSVRNTPDGRTTGRQLWIMNADGTSIRQLTAGSGASLAPAWSPDGGQIAFHSNSDGEFEIYTIAVDSAPGDGTDARVQLTANVGINDQNPTWKPDGTRIAFERGGSSTVGDTSKELWTMDPDGTGQVQLTMNADYDAEPSWSPDGTRIAYQSDADPDNDQEILSMPATGGAFASVTTTTSGIADGEPDWGPGAQTTISSGPSGLTNVASPSFAFDASPAESTFECRLDGPAGAVGAWQECVSPKAYSGLADGAYTFWVRATDPLGNTDLSPASRSFTIDTKAPAAPVISSPAENSVSTSSTIVLSGTAEPGSAVEILEGTVPKGSATTDGNGNWLVQIAGVSDGAHSYTARATDAAGNTSPSSSARTVRVDTSQTGGSAVDEGPKASCSEKAGFGVMELIGCWTKEGDVWVSTGNVGVNGLMLVPVGGARLTVDPAGRRIDSGDGRFNLFVGPFSVYEGPIAWRLATTSAVTLLGKPGARLGDLPLAGQDLTISFVRGAQARLRALASMPFFEALQRYCAAFCPNVTADLVAVTDNATGLQDDGLKLGARNILLGLAVVESFDALYVLGKGTWEATGTLRLNLPQALRVKSHWVVERGLLKSATANVRGIKSPISVGVSLQRLDLSLRTQPFEIHGGLGMTAGPTLLGKSALTSEGNFLFRPAPIGPKGHGGLLRVEGGTRIVDVPVATGHVQLWPSGAFDFASRVAMGLPNLGAANPRSQPVYVGASLSGWLARRAFSAEGAAEILVYGQALARGELVVSSVGFAACGQMGWLRAGAARRWTGPVAVMAGSCDVAPYRARASAQAAQAGALTLPLPDAPKGLVLRFRGDGGAPLVVLEGPNGQRIAAPADGAPIVDDDFVVVQDQQGAATHVAIRRPAGDWRVTTAAGSPRLAGVDSAEVLAPPAVKAAVRGKGSKRILTWRVKRQPGQRVTFVERGTDASRVIKRTSAASGRVRFSPAGGNARSRRILAIVEQSGVPRDSLTVARYTAPAWKRPGRPRKLRAARRGSSVLVRWRRVRGAAEYGVLVRTAEGERELYLTPRRRTQLRVRGVGRRERAVVQVHALRSDGAPGPRSTLLLKPAKRKPRR